MPQKATFKDWFFSKIHQNKLVYNTCWEDPRCDRMLMDLQEDSEIVMITSAGCNALDYALDNPVRIHCVDMNYRQNALLELKIAGFQSLDAKTYFELFGKGVYDNVTDLYRKKLRSHLSADAQKYWDKHINYFAGKGIRRSFYYRGTSGLLAYGITRFMKLERRMYRNVERLFQAANLDEQAKYFSDIESLFYNGTVQRLVNSPYTMALAGVPQNQQQLIHATYSRGTIAYVEDCFRKIFTTMDITENYFYQVYFNGSYTYDCCPEYLKAGNFETLREQTENIATHTTTVSQFLKDNPGKYSHFVLLDHQDWLDSNSPDLLVEEWELILQNSRPGTKILMRSAAKEITYFPDFVKERVVFDKQKAAEVHESDRVGTYASVYLGVVQ